VRSRLPPSAIGALGESAFLITGLIGNAVCYLACRGTLGNDGEPHAGRLQFVG